MAAFQSSLCALLLLYSVIKVSGQDGKLIVPAVWKDGARIEVICKQYSTACSGGTITQVVFKKDGTIFCPLDNTKWNGNCLTSTPDYPVDRCWCKTGTNGAIDYIYWFWADMYVSNGTWTCEITCLPNVGFPSPLNIDVTEGFGKTVSGNPGEEQRSCSAAAKVCLDSDRSKAICRCGNNQKPPYCDECDYLDEDCNKKGKNLAVGFIIAFCVAVAIVLILSILLYLLIRALRELFQDLIAKAVLIYNYIHFLKFLWDILRGNIKSSGTEPKPDYDKPATNSSSTGHTATGSKKNGQGVTPL